MTEPKPAEPLVAALERLADIKDRAALAALRRSLGEDSIALAYPYVIPFLPRDASPWLQRVYLLVAGLFALHPVRGSSTLGTALRRVSEMSNSNSIEQRFVALLNADPEDLGSHLRHAISLVRSKEIAVDWNDLLRTVRNWNDRSRRRWASDFWAGTLLDKGATK